MKAIELFAGVGGFRCGLERAGHEVIWANEWDKWACDTYDKNFPGKIDRRDITTVPAADIPPHELITGGFPCQAFSVAGKRRGFEETRGTLFFDILRIARHHRTPYLLLENVKGLLNHDGGRTFYTILGSLDESGYDVQWQVCNSKDFGVPQNRERVLIVANSRTRPRPQVFPLGGDDAVSDGALGQAGSQTDLASTLRSGKGGGAQSNIEDNFIVHQNHGRIEQTDDLAHTLDSSYHKGLDNHGQRTAIAVARRGRDDGAKWEARSDEIANAVMTSAGGSSHGMVVERTPLRFLDRNQKNIEGDYSFTVDTSNTGGVKVAGRIRRLTPVECERLQGFPDNWTAGTADKPMSDTQRYRQMGNAVTTNVIEAVARCLPMTA